MTSAAEYNKRHVLKGAITGRNLATLAEHWQQAHYLEVDGKIGPETIANLEFAHETDTSPRGTNWIPWDGPLSAIPDSRRQVYETFGNPGAGKVDTKWRASNVVTVRDLPGIPHKWWFKCHRLAEPYMREALRRAALSEPEYQIDRAASFVFRHQRHNVARPLSYHSWGIAIDIDAASNSAHRFKDDQAPKPWSDKWLELWPHGLSEKFVQAFESVGFTWGGRWSRYADPMHFQLCAS